MRAPWRSPVEPDRVDVQELVEHGLDRHPEALGIVWPDGVLVCRRHVEDPLVRRVMGQLRRPADTAAVLTSRYSNRLLPSCIHCTVQTKHMRRVTERRTRR